MRGAALLAGAWVVFVFLSGWETARAEEAKVYVGLYGGLAFPEDLENVTRQPSGAALPDLKLARLGDEGDHPLDGLIAGGKLGFIPEPEFTWFGLEAEIFVAPNRIEPDQAFEGEEITTVTVAFNSIFRIAGGPIEPYVGAGPSIVWSDGIGGQATAVGLNLLAGARILLGERVFLFGEVKHNRSKLDFPAATADYRLNAVVGGLAVAF